MLTNTNEYINNKLSVNGFKNFELPLGLRELKINTTISMDGYRACITSGSLKDKRLGMEPIVQFSYTEKINNYFKRLEKFVEKVKNAEKEKRAYLYSDINDKVDKSTNLFIYDLYIDKLENSIFSRRPKASTLCEKLRVYRDKFISLEIKEQSKQLSEIHKAFGRFKEINLKTLGGSEKECIVRESINLSNWRDYSDIRIIDTSASGLWEKESQNLLELL